MPVYSLAKDDTGTVAHPGSIVAGTYPLNILRIRQGRNDATTTIAGRRASVLRIITTADTGTAATLEQHSSRSGASDPTGIVTVTVNGNTPGNPLIFAGVGIQQEIVCDWTPPRPWARIQVGSQTNAGLCLAGNETLTRAYGYTDATEEQELGRYGTARGRGRRGRSSVMHYGSHNTVHAAKAAPSAYDVNRQAFWWACWTRPRQYRARQNDGGINTLNALATGPASHRMLTGLGI